ncbi:hypothetical protein DPM13_12415 [Paracoccus mutanolyticus]|uniref:Uncharacterized protein n=1 Tax=Paracoccus mutanolyticus TaxID=1499308 RepID=A0ABM6WSH8_9RHOB|nr:hypothetical protein [Paracoccus mutanolyticus]AWX93619.1 hypothetical protein DPM13_12415 [Paracoccus mutanolyticus]
MRDAGRLAKAAYRDAGARCPAMITHELRTYKSVRDLPREGQLAWKIAEVAADRRGPTCPAPRGAP